MRTSINGKEADWTPAILAKWHTFADAADPKLTDFTVTSANYFVPRPAVDTYNRGSREEGFVFTLKPKGASYGGERVHMAVISTVPHPPTAAPPSDGTFDPSLSSK